ncbi:MAG: sigma-70 family RNA polymerase sigma factor [Sedimentisphaerales bacterium]|nr:sigma-70 family RNA polymerase sigma factor [Sedimentisphaerales bacterium]
MSNDQDCVELVRRAQRGEQDSRDRLTCLVAPSMRTYLYRLTLAPDLTEDLLQETLLHMLESLEDLKRAEAFWPWLYRTALGKAQHHFRDRQMRRKAADPSVACVSPARSSASSDENDGLSALLRRELIEALFEAMGRLSLRQRAVVVLRCFEQKPYADIAAVMGCSEIAAEVLFFRAKRSLRRHLSHRGFKAGLLGVGLGMFARETSSVAGFIAGPVSGASLKVGVVAQVIGAAGMPFGVGMGIAATVALVAIIAWGAIGHGESRMARRSPAAQPVQEQTSVVFDYPSRLLHAYDPDGDGWEVIEADQVVSIPADPNEWLVGPPPSAQSSVVMPVGHWIELEFDGRILDGPGDDIEVVEWGANGEEADIFVTDGGDRLHFVGVLKAPLAGLQVDAAVGFDIAAAAASFVPRAVRVVSRTGGGGTPGFDLHCVRARIEKAPPQN